MIRTTRYILRIALPWILALSACSFAPTDFDPVLQPNQGQTESLASKTQPIINGERCDARVHASAVAVIFEGRLSIPGMGADLSLRQVICTGTLIAPDVVLTAAHCLAPELLTGGYGSVENGRFYVSFTDDLSELAGTSPVGSSPGNTQLAPLPSDTLEATHWIRHPDFDLALLQRRLVGPSNFFDLGLLFLETPVKDVQPAVLIAKEEASQLRTSAPVGIAGWGQRSAESSAWGTTPKTGSAGVKYCATSFINEMGAHEIQIGGASNTARKCHGDSGGPTYLDIETHSSRKERLIGVTSHAYDATDCAKGGLDTRVDVWLDWLDGEMRKACLEMKRSWCELVGVVPAQYYDPTPTEPSDPAPDPTSEDPQVQSDPLTTEPNTATGGCALCDQQGSSKSNRPFLGIVLLALLTLIVGRRSRSCRYGSRSL
jgi:hypothetical protein